MNLEEQLAAFVERYRPQAPEAVGEDFLARLENLMYAYAAAAIVREVPGDLFERLK